MKPIYIPCDCRTPYHCLVIDDGDYDESRTTPLHLNVSFVSTRNGSIWHRIKWALKHVFGREDLTFADIIIKTEDLLEALDAVVPDSTPSLLQEHNANGGKED